MMVRTVIVVVKVVFVLLVRHLSAVRARADGEVEAVGAGQSGFPAPSLTHGRRYGRRNGSRSNQRHSV